MKILWRKKLLQKMHLKWNIFEENFTQKCICHRCTPCYDEGLLQYFQFISGGGLQMMATQFFSSGGFESLMAGAMANLDQQVIVIINYHGGYHGFFYEFWFYEYYHGNYHSRGNGKSGCTGCECCVALLPLPLQHNTKFAT